MVDAAEANALSLERELDWFSHVLEARLRAHFGEPGVEADPGAIEPPDLSSHESAYAKFVQHYELSFDERLIIVMSLMPHVRPQLLDPLLIKNAELERAFTEFGGVPAHDGFLPNGETALFLIAGDDLARRFQAMPLLGPDHFFARHGILSCRPPGPNEPGIRGMLQLSREFLDFFTAGRASPPAFSEDFPAKRIESREEWSDLVLNSEVLTRIQDIHAWFRHGARLMNDLGYARRMRPGYRCLFYGPPGTGKTMTAALLATEAGREIYRIDLGTVVSKWVGETSKNLARIFDQAQSRDWVLFFDEADALFTKRTQLKDAHDRYANQEVAFLLQRIEDFDGVVILATNFRDQLDDAFTRRFDSIIHFPMPTRQERLRIWSNAINGHVGVEPQVNLAKIAERYELSGGAILNVVRYAALMALNGGSSELSLVDLERGVRQELQKESRSLAQ